MESPDLSSKLWGIDTFMKEKDLTQLRPSKKIADRAQIIYFKSILKQLYEIETLLRKVHSLMKRVLWERW